MTTARDIIALVIQSIEVDIEHAHGIIEYSDGEIKHLNEQKASCYERTNSYTVADATYDGPIGRYHGIIFDNKERINALNRMLDYWRSLDEICAEEEKLEEAEEDEEE